MTDLSPLRLSGSGVPVVILTDHGTANPARSVGPTGPAGVVLHSPGVTWVAKVAKKLEAELEVDMTPEHLDHRCAVEFDVRRYQPGYLVGQTGVVYKLARDTQRTSHAGGRRAGLYRNGHWRRYAKPLGGDGIVTHGRDPAVVYDWFDAEYGTGVDPTDLLDGRSPNEAIGIDLRPALDGPRYSEQQLQSAATLVAMLADTHGFPLDHCHVVTHSLVAPMERGAVLRGGKIVGTPWDPGKGFDLGAFLASAKAAS